MDSVIESKVKCPNKDCKSEDIVVTELWANHSIEFEQVDGKIDRRKGNLVPGDPTGLVAHCSCCGKRWKIRGAIQITDIIK